MRDRGNNWKQRGLQGRQVDPRTRFEAVQDEAEGPRRAPRPRRRSSHLLRRSQGGLSRSSVSFGSTALVAFYSPLGS